MQANHFRRKVAFWVVTSLCLTHAMRTHAQAGDPSEPPTGYAPTGAPPVTSKDVAESANSTSVAPEPRPESNVVAKPANSTSVATEPRPKSNVAAESADAANSTSLATEPQPESNVVAKSANTISAATELRPESNVVSLAGREGFRWRTRGGDFEFNPYTLVQAYAQANYVDNRWLALTDQDNVRALGFGTSNAIFGVAGKGFERITFNLALNAACSGPCLLNQAWMDLQVSEALRFRIGKFKVPSQWAVQVRVGQTLFPRLPVSLLSRVNLPFGLNSVTPSIALGFDTGVMMHGILAKRFEYQIGIFNGEGAGVNAPSSTLSDDGGVPGLLYAARFSYFPLGPMRLEETATVAPSPTRLLLAASTSYNVEANSESSNDLRGGFEAALRHGRVYASMEAYALRMAFVERQRGVAAKTFVGSYVQVGVNAGRSVEPMARFEVFDRNSLSSRGVLLVPSVGLNYYLFEQNLKLSAVYQGLARARYRTDLEAHQDDNALYDHSGLVQLQFAL
ncbi:MAG: porin [Polyangiaceae bacterium]